MSDQQEEQAQEEGCIGTTFERKYWELQGRAFVKRCLRPREYKTGYMGLFVPRLAKERLQNGADTLSFIRNNTDIPVPDVYAHFEDDGAYYLVTEYIHGTAMSQLEEGQKAVVREEIETHRRTLASLKSRRLGGPSGIVVPPYRVMRLAKADEWDLRQAEESEEDYVFCHNDFSQYNVIVDPDTLRIRAILDWEYAGFFPARFEFPFYQRLGPSVAVKDEVDDSGELLDFLVGQSRDPAAVVRLDVPSDGVVALQGDASL